MSYDYVVWGAEEADAWPEEEIPDTRSRKLMASTRLTNRRIKRPKLSCSPEEQQESFD